MGVFVRVAYTQTHVLELSLTEQVEPEVEMDNAAIVSDPGSSLYLSGHNKPYDPRAAADAQESMKAKLIAIRKKLVEQVRHLYLSPRSTVDSREHKVLGT